MNLIPDIQEEGILLPRAHQGRKKPFVCAPLDWIQRAAETRSQFAVLTALLVWFRKCVTQEEQFSVSNVAASQFGLNRKQKAAGLKALASANMISVRPRPGRSPLVEITE